MRARPHALALAVLAVPVLAVPRLGAVDAEPAGAAASPARPGIDADAARSQRLHLAVRAGVRATRSAHRPGPIWPVPPVVTSEFGTRWGRPHTGIDFDAPTGEPIRTIADGQTAFAGWKNGYGNVVVVDHGDGFTTMYAHQSEIAVAPGQRVTKGDVVGRVGSSGRSTAPHLHFETRVHDVPHDPRGWLPTG